MQDFANKTDTHSNPQFNLNQTLFYQKFFQHRYESRSKLNQKVTEATCMSFYSDVPQTEVIRRSFMNARDFRDDKSNEGRRNWPGSL